MSYMVMMFVIIKSYYFNGVLWQVCWIWWNKYLLYCNEDLTDWLLMTKNQRDESFERNVWYGRYRKNILCYSILLCTFLCLLRTLFQTWLGVWFIAYIHVCFYINGWIHSGESNVSIILCPLDRIGFLGKCGYFSHDRFDVVWDS